MCGISAPTPAALIELFEAPAVKLRLFKKEMKIIINSKKPSVDSFSETFQPLFAKMASFMIFERNFISLMILELRFFIEEQTAVR